MQLNSSIICLYSVLLLFYFPCLSTILNSLGNNVCGTPCSYTSNKNFILKYFRCRDGKRTETRIGMEGICITHSCIPLYTVYMQHIMAHSGGMQEWVIQIPSIPILVSVLFPSLHLKYFRIKFLLLVFMRMRTKPHPHPVIAKPHPHRRTRRALKCWLCLPWSVPFLPSPEVLNSC